MLSPGLYTQLACIWEATARKPGNVHRYRDFADASYVDFLVSAAAIAPVMDRAHGRPVGQTVLEAVRATRQVVASNTNLGIILLLAPLAAVPEDEDLRTGVERILSRLDVEDSRLVYEAIRLAQPGGLGKVQDQDIAEPPTWPLRQIMALAAIHDRIALQYALGYQEIFEEGLTDLTKALARMSLEEAVGWVHLGWMARHPDSLISRKRGWSEAETAARMARVVLDAGWPDTQEGKELLESLDAWLRAEGHARNPGTSADLVAACLFVAFREGIIQSAPPISH